MKAAGSSPDICARCSRVFGSCCIAGDGEEVHHTLVSGHEASVILKAVACAGDEEVLMSEPNDEVFIKRIGSIFPDRLDDVVKAFPLQQMHRSLSVDCFGRCTLLGSSGCSLEEKEKPLFCRIYPFWFIDGILVTFNNNRCLALVESSDITKQMEFFNTDEAELGELYREIVSLWLGR